MAFLLGILILGFGGQETVRLQLRGGVVREGVVLGIDPEGNYVVRTADGRRATVPYRDVLHVEEVRGAEAKGGAQIDGLRWPEYVPLHDPVGRIVQDLSGLPQSTVAAAARSFSDAVEYVRAGDRKVAVRELDSAVETDPEWISARLLRAALYMDLGLLARAYADVEYARDRAPDLVLAYELSAEVALRRGLVSQGAHLYAEGLARIYQGAEREWRLSHFWRPRDSAKALRHFKAYQEADPEFSFPWSVEGVLLKRFRAARESGRYEEAGRYVSELCLHSPLAAECVQTELGEFFVDRAEHLAMEGVMTAATADIAEAGRLLPEARDEIERTWRDAASRAWYEELGQARTVWQVARIESELRALWPRLPKLSEEAVRGAYLRLCQSYLTRGAYDSALACCKAALAQGASTGDLHKVLRSIKSAPTGPSAESAEEFCRLVYGMSVNGLHTPDACALLEPQLAWVRQEFTKGRVDSARTRLAKLEEWFGSRSELSALENELAAKEVLARDVESEVAVPDSGRTIELLSYFPLEEGWWWRYGAENGRSEEWRITQITTAGDVTCAKLEGSLSEGDATWAAQKEVYFTGSTVLAGGQSTEAGGRVLLWTPITAGGAGSDERNGGSRREWRYAGIREKVRCGAVAFTDCLHVVVRNSLDVAGRSRGEFSVESHYWYAPGVGLVKIVGQHGGDWELRAWGRGESPVSAEASAASLSERTLGPDE